MLIRPTRPEDAEALAAIYAPAVLHGLGTFEERPPSPAEMEVRRGRIAAAGLPHLVAELDGRVAGYAYAGPFRPRPGYRYTVEDSLYVAPDAQGRGVGHALLSELLARLEPLGIRRVLALVGDSGNAGSLAVHARCGFERVGVIPAAGVKFGRWVDVVWLHRALNGGDADVPQGGGLELAEA